ncbi:hypothetical protein HMPREF9278_1232 [Mobiluncus mulieris FB024-16]|nr:hypothetical protein HMPREF9278_1232 [Mobiluncus mulieris FB024-16]
MQKVVFKRTQHIASRQFGMPLTHPCQHKNPHKYDCNTETKYRRIPRVHEVPSGIPGVSLGTAPAKIPVSVLPF